MKETQLMSTVSKVVTRVAQIYMTDIIPNNLQALNLSQFAYSTGRCILIQCSLYKYIFL